MKITTVDEENEGVDSIDYGENALPSSSFYMKKFDDKIKERLMTGTALEWLGLSKEQFFSGNKV